MLDIDGIARALEAEYPELNEGTGVRIRPFTDTQIGDEPKTVLWTMFGAVAFVLLIACANVANLLIGRAIVRGREVGIRTSLGASRLNVALPFLVESALLASAGAILGTGSRTLASGSSAPQWRAPAHPNWLQFRLDGVALVFVAVATALAAVLAGVIPAVQAAHAPVSDILKDESRGTSRAQRPMKARRRTQRALSSRPATSQSSMPHH
jgi:putative ABC transport system permease protein